MKKFEITISTDKEYVTKENILIAISYQFPEINRQQISVVE